MRLSALILVVSTLTLSSRTGLATSQNWEQANVATIRLKPSAFPSVSARVREELDRRGCGVPQGYSDRVPHNVVQGRFTSNTQTDIAVLCSKAQISSILVFRGGSTASVSELAKRPDSEFLQVVASGGVVGYSRVLGVADPKYIQEHHQRYGGPKPPGLDHDGIDDIFVGKASVVWFWSGGRWLQLQGAD
jgi:hypothetical protein